MLIRPEPSPAAADRRRLLSSLTMTGLLSITAWACLAPPPDASDWDGVRAALGRAVRELRPVDPSAADEVERLVADAEGHTAAEAAAPFWRRDSGRGSAAWSRATVTARRSVGEVRALRAAQEERLERLLTTAEPRIEVAARRIGRSGVSGSNAGQVSAGRTHLAAARSLAAHGEYAAALDHATRAVALAAELEAAWHRNHERFSDPALLALWQSLAEATIEESRRTGKTAIVVDKLRRVVSLYRAGRRVARFDAELGGNGLERKRYSGDRATPEGRYRITVKKSRGATKYYLALLIDYPNDEDRRRYQQGVSNGTIPRSAGIGGLIEIHGGGGSGKDWTDGCVALTNEDMDHLFPAVTVGTPVTIVGTL